MIAMIRPTTTTPKIAQFTPSHLPAPRGVSDPWVRDVPTASGETSYPSPRFVRTAPPARTVERQRHAIFRPMALNDAHPVPRPRLFRALRTPPLLFCVTTDVCNTLHGASTPGPSAQEGMVDRVW